MLVNRICPMLAAILLMGRLLQAQEADPQGEGSIVPEPGEVDVGTDRVVFHWSEVPGAQAYHLQVGKTLLFLPATVDQRTDRAFLTVAKDSLPPRLYYWRVGAVARDGTKGGFSPSRILNLNPPPERGPERPAEPPRKGVIIYKPTEPWSDQVFFCPSKEGKAAVTFRWEGQAWRSRLQVAADEDFSHVEMDQNLIKKFATVGIGVGTHYYRLAQYRKRKGVEPVWSTPRRFHVKTDDTPPLLRIATPASQVFTVLGRLTVQGATEPGSEVRVNDREVAVSARGEFKFVVPLADGRNELGLVARDAAGNESRAVVVAVRIPPSLHKGMLARLVALQQRLNELDAQREDLELQSEELTLSLLASNKNSPEMAEQVLALGRELRADKALKGELDTAVSGLALEMKRRIKGASGGKKEGQPQRRGKGKVSRPRK